MTQSDRALAGKKCPQKTKSTEQKVDDIAIDGFAHTATVCVKADGTLHGPAQAFHDNGKVWIRGQYEDGSKSGTWTKYFENGQRAAEGPYKSGERHGPWQRWLNNGQLSEAGDYKYGFKSGTWKYYLGGKVSNTIFYDTTVRQQITCPKGTTFQGVKTSEDGGDLQWCEKKGLKHGPYREWADRSINDEPILIGQYDSGKRVGKWKWSNDVTGHMTLTGSYKAGKQVGVWEDWTYDMIGGYGHVRTRRRNFRAGKLHGRCMKWHANGKIAEQSNYVEGKLHGTLRKYDEAGELVKEEEYEHGKVQW